MTRTTSIEAYESVQPHTPTLRSRVLSFISERGSRGATDEEVQFALGINPSTVRPRRLELEKLVLICASGEKRTTSSGRKALVWVAVGHKSSTSGNEPRKRKHDRDQSV